MIVWMCLPALAAPTIDGDFNRDEWTIDGTAYYAEEDWVRRYDGYVGPGYGGQEFDVEYLGLFIDDQNLYFGLQTGFELNYGESAGNAFYEPGDIALDFRLLGDQDQEKDYEFGFRFSIPGIQGLNTGQSGVEYDAVLETYFNPQWSDPTLYPEVGQYRVTSGSGEEIEPVYEAKYQRFGDISYDPYQNALEASISLDSIAGKLAQIGVNPGSSYEVTIHWTMECGNDVLNQSFTFNAPQPVPEPATILFLATGLIGLGAAKRKKGRSI